jgi:putative ABC transport system permease protein
VAEAAFGGAWRWFIGGELRAHPMRFVIAGIAIAVGVALGFAVHVVNRSAAETFGEAVRAVSGDADLQVRAASDLGFDESLYPRLIGLDAVQDASPVVRLNARIGDRPNPVPLLGIDPLRALSVTPGLLGRSVAPASGSAEAGRPAAPEAIFDGNALYLSQAAQERWGLRTGDSARVNANGRTHLFKVAGDIPGAAPNQLLAIIDIAAAQWRFGRLGKLDRVDLKLRQGAGLSDS